MSISTDFDPPTAHQAIVDRVGALPAVKDYYRLPAKQEQPLAHVYAEFAKL